MTIQKEIKKLYFLNKDIGESPVSSLCINNSYQVVFELSDEEINEIIKTKRLYVTVHDSIPLIQTESNSKIF